MLELGIIHTVIATSANVADVTQISKLIKKAMMLFMGTLGYMRIEKRKETVGNETLKNKEYRICKKTGKIRKARTVMFKWADVKKESKENSLFLNFDKLKEMLIKFFLPINLIFKTIGKSSQDKIKYKRVHSLNVFKTVKILFNQCVLNTTKVLQCRERCVFNVKDALNITIVDRPLDVNNVLQ